MDVVAGDIGGTKVLLQIAQTDGPRTHCGFERRYESAAFASFTDLLRGFLGEAAGAGEFRPGCACFAVAGPVENRVARVTNLPWVIDAAALERDFELHSVELVNDFAAIGHSIDLLPESAFVTLQRGHPTGHGVRVLVGAGTGLGHCLMVDSAENCRVFPSEAGHAHFAPCDELQQALAGYLTKRYGRVTWERVVSGPGLADIYRFFNARAGTETECERVLAAGDGARAVAQRADARVDPQATQALRLFVRLYGARAGDLALTVLPFAGLYVAGGIAPRLIGPIREGEFMQGFHDKDARMQGLLERVPVQVVMNERAGLEGAAYLAALQCE